MATVKAIKYGQKGDQVANLQTTLNNLGYNLDVDGSFGPKTLAAVKDYQQKNGLAVDGMVGPQTQASLWGGSSGTTTTGNATNTNPATTTPAATTPTTPTPTTPTVTTPTVTTPAATTPATTPAVTKPATTTPTVTTPTTTTPTTTPTVTTPTVTTPTVTKPTVTTPTVNTSASGNKNTGFTYDPYQSSGAVDKAVGDGFSYDDFTYDDYQSSGAVDKAKGDGFSYDNFSYADYAESETVKQANAALQAALAAQPGAYQSKWQDQINGIIDKILNREQFSYDYNEDALYKQYAEQYARGGKLAMQDTMGQAAAMTGGYGSSYASTAGNQAYQEYMSQLNSVIPELYGMALDRYQMEGQEMYNQYGLLNDQESQDYSRYMDSYNKWLAERDYAAGRYDSERNFDYGKYTDDRNFSYGVYSDDKNYAYSDYRNNIEDAKWQEQQEYAQYSDDRNFNYGVYADDKSYDYNDYRATIEDAKWQEENEYKQYLDKLGIAYDEHMNAYELEQLAIQNGFTERQLSLSEKEYADALKQQQIDNAYRETARQDALNSEAKAYAREDVMNIIAAGGTPTDAQLAAAGMSKEAAEALKTTYQNAGSGKDLSASEIKGISSEVATLAGDGNLEAAESYLTSLVSKGYMSNEEAKSFLAPYVEVEEEEIVDTGTPIWTPQSTGTNYPDLPLDPSQAFEGAKLGETEEEKYERWLKNLLGIK